MTAHHTARLTRTFTRAELTAAVTAAGDASLAECFYSRPDDGGRPTLALDYDDPGDLGLFIHVVCGLLQPAEALAFASALDTGMPGHPDGETDGTHGAWWRGFALDEPTRDQWSDEITDCGACAAEDHDGPDCLTHARAPWQPQLSGVS